MVAVKKDGPGRLNSDRFVSLDGFITYKERQQIASARVLLAGLGAGSNVAPLLARDGVGTSGAGEIILADPDSVEGKNLVRQVYREKDLGKNKARAVAKLCQEINSSIKVSPISEGITKKNLPDLVNRADVVFEMIDVTVPDISFRLHKMAHCLGKPAIVTLDLGDNTLTRVFINNKHSISYLSYFGFPPDLTERAYQDLNPYAIVAQLVIGPYKGRLFVNPEKAAAYYNEGFFSRERNMKNLLARLPSDIRPLVKDIITGKLKHLPQTGIAGQLLGAIHMKLLQDIILGKKVPDAKFAIKLYLTDMLTSSTNNS